MDAISMVIQCKSAIATLATVNLQKLMTFYSQLLGQTPQKHIPNVYAEFQLPGLQLGIFQYKQQNAAEFAAASGKMSLCLEVVDLTDAIACMANLGGPPPGEISTASHGQEIYAYDPDGNRLILHQSS
jgi:predicted enzyme related to lactoylglutathione lyase